MYSYVGLIDYKGDDDVITMSLSGLLKKLWRFNILTLLRLKVT